MIFFEYLIIAIAITLVLVFAIGLAMIGFAFLFEGDERGLLRCIVVGLLFLCIDFAFIATVLTLTFGA